MKMKFDAVISCQHICIRYTFVWMFLFVNWINVYNFICWHCYLLQMTPHTANKLNYLELISIDLSIDKIIDWFHYNIQLPVFLFISSFSCLFRYILSLYFRTKTDMECKEIPGSLKCDGFIC